MEIHCAKSVVQRNACASCYCLPAAPGQDNNTPSDQNQMAALFLSECKELRAKKKKGQFLSEGQKKKYLGAPLHFPALLQWD